jgi:hypothetical protein
MMQTLDLGGPGPGCSAMAVRRLVAGELQGAERDRLSDHVKGCARCQVTERELATERTELAAAIPFDRFAAGVAERLARPAKVSRFSRPMAWASMAIAASLLAVVGAQVWLHELGQGSPREVATRVKGGAGAQLYVQDQSGSRALGPNESVASGAKLLLSLEPAGHRFAAAALVDRDGPAVLYVGPAKAGPLPQAFEWTAEGTARLIVQYADQPIDQGSFLNLLGKGLGPPAGAEQVTLELKH